MSIKTLDFNYSMGRPQKIGGSYHGSKRKLLIGIENIVSVASDLVDEVARLKSVRLRIKEELS
ncbi:hypothetical protein [Priestia megaterium]|uniref:hypothetical protein n=1 Tax=Priestia megaterium TaxID=1404 RepID=UPI002E1CA361|nr:hypothetical protein [Priestia megaterium]